MSISFMIFLDMKRYINIQDKHIKIHGYTI